MDREVIELTTEDTYPLRLAVLRAGTPSNDASFDGDDLATTFHLGVRLGGSIVAVSTWMERRYPDRPDGPGFQLRGMASGPAHRGSGLARMVLEVGIERCRQLGASLVWARARDEAIGFYKQHGFVVVGKGYIDLVTDLPHHDIIKVLE